MPYRILPLTIRIMVSLTLASAALSAEFPAPNRQEAEAIAAGKRAGVGSVTLEGPRTVEVMSHQTWTLVYTAGKAGVGPAGGIRIAMRHLPQWTPPQTKNPQAPGYLTVTTSQNRPVKVYADYGGSRSFFPQYFAWQNMVEVTVAEPGLAPGETLAVTYGDRSGGSPGIRVQPFDESHFMFKVYADPSGNGQHFPMEDSPAIEIVAAEPYRLGVIMPSDAVAGQPTWCLVRAEDRYGNPATGYRGTITWQSTDPDAQLPQRYTFTESDGGVHRFEGLTFNTAGPQTVTVDDSRFRRTGNPVRVAAAGPEQLLLWGDLHGHTLFSDGRGTVEEYYDFAEQFSGLDFCAVSDHAFEILAEMWEHSKAVTNLRNKPGRFVTFQGYEWSGNSRVGGDHNVYFLDDDPPMYRSTSYYTPENLQMYHGPDPKLAHVTDLFAELNRLIENKDVFCIPHYGGRQGNPTMHDPKVQRLIEIYSEHRRSEDWAGKFLANGHRLGIMASTDNHYGNPGYGYLRPSFDWDKQEIGMAMVAVYAPERTRESIFQALYDRRTYATSGSRIILDVRCDGQAMGSEYRTAGPPVLTVEAVGTSPIAAVQIKKNSRIVHTIHPGKTAVSLRWQDPDFQADRSCYYYVRIEQEDDEEAISSPIWVN